MELKGIEKALHENCKIHGFRSGGGLRVVRIVDEASKLRGYGEHPQVEDALSHANEDFLAGGRPYSEVYGVTKPHYLTGSQTATSMLDEWLLRGNTFDAYTESQEVVLELHGYSESLDRIMQMGKGANFDEALNKAYGAEPVLKE